MADAQLTLLAPLLVLVAGGILLPLRGSKSAGERGFTVFLALVALIASALLSLATLYRVPGLGFMSAARAATNGTAYGVYHVDAFALAFQLVFITVAALVVLGSPRYMKGSRHIGEYYALLILSTLGMMVVAASRDLVTLFIGFELSSFATYALAGYFKDDPTSNEAALKYFIIGSLSSSLTLFGTSLFYGLVGSTQFADVGQYTATVFQEVGRSGATFPPLLIFAWGFLLAGFGYKIALVPFHNWAPDVYDGAPSTVSAFLAAGSKKMGFAALFKLFLVGLIAIKANWLWVAAVVAVITMTVGNVIALNQTNIKRMLAYSSIAQAGYMLIALPIATQYALAGGVFQILTHGVMKTGAFLVVAAFATFGVGELLSDWRGMGRRAPVIAFSMTIFLLSLAGIPPLAGFTSKFVLFSAAIDAGGWFVWLAIAGILNSALSLYYYARVIRIMYVEEEGVPAARLSAGAGVTAAIVIAALGTVLIGLWPDPFVDLSLRAATALIP